MQEGQKINKHINKASAQVLSVCNIKGGGRVSKGKVFSLEVQLETKGLMHQIYNIEVNTIGDILHLHSLQQRTFSTKVYQQFSGEISIFLLYKKKILGEEQ